MTTDSFWFIIFFGEKIRFPVNSFNDYITGDYIGKTKYTTNREAGDIKSSHPMTKATGLRTLENI